MGEHDAAGADAPATFAEGQADPAHHPEDLRRGRFGDGQARPTGEVEDGRFSEGMEALGPADPEKHAEGSFGDTQGAGEARGS